MHTLTQLLIRIAASRFVGGMSAGSVTISNSAGVIARGRLRQLRRAVDCFGFHLASLDIRQNSAVHERTIAELIDAAMPGVSYMALNEEARVALLAKELSNARPLTSAFVEGAVLKHLSPAKAAAAE